MYHLLLPWFMYLEIYLKIYGKNHGRTNVYVFSRNAVVLGFILRFKIHFEKILCMVQTGSQEVSVCVYVV